MSCYTHHLQSGFRISIYQLTPAADSLKNKSLLLFFLIGHVFTINDDILVFLFLFVKRLYANFNKYIFLMYVCTVFVKFYDKFVTISIYQTFVI